MARKEDSRVTIRATSQLRTIENRAPAHSKGILWYLLLRFLFRGVGIRRDRDDANLSKWDNLLKNFVRNPENGIPQTSEAMTSARGNLTSQVYSEDEGLSMSTFVKASAVCGAEEVRFIVEWKMKNGERIVGKVAYPLTPDVLVNLSEEDKDTKLLEEVHEVIQKSQDDPEIRGELKAVIDKLKDKIAQKESEKPNVK